MNTTRVQPNSHRRTRAASSEKVQGEKLIQSRSRSLSECIGENRDADDERKRSPKGGELSGGNRVEQTRPNSYLSASSRKRWREGSSSSRGCDNEDDADTNQQSNRTSAEINARPLSECTASTAETYITIRTKRQIVEDHIKCTSAQVTSISFDAIRHSIS